MERRQEDSDDHRSEDEQGWHTVGRRRSGVRNVNFFFTRFPDSWDENALLQMFRKYGSVSSIFVAQKRTRKGTRFGFVKFACKEDWRDMEKRLQSIIIGNRRLVINKERYGSKKKFRNNNVSKTVHGKFKSRANSPKPAKMHEKAKESNSRVDGRSYRDVAMGKHKSDKKDDKSSKKEDHVINGAIHLQFWSRLENCWVCKLKDIDCLRNIQKILKEDGLGQCLIQYVGGLHVLCEWPSAEVARQCLEKNKEALKFWMEDVRMWDDSLSFQDRLTWLDIEGLPVEAWSDTTIRRIAELFGEVLEIDEPKFDGSMNNVCGALILTNKMEEVNTTVKVNPRSKIIKVKVFEAHNRAIFFSTTSEDSQSDDQSSLGDEDMNDGRVSDSFSDDQSEFSYDRNPTGVGLAGEGSGNDEGSGIGNAALETEAPVDMPETNNFEETVVEDSMEAGDLKTTSGPDLLGQTNVGPNNYFNKKDISQMDTPNKGNRKRGLVFGGRHSLSGVSDSIGNSCSSKDSQKKILIGKALGVEYGNVEGDGADER